MQSKCLVAFCVVNWFLIFVVGIRISSWDLVGSPFFSLLVFMHIERRLKFRREVGT